MTLSVCFGGRAAVSLRAMATAPSRREKLYRAYMTFFERAERTRRWSVFDDIPWDELRRSRPDPELAWGAETFCAVEMYLPDYTAAGVNVVRDSFGQAWFQANWAYEESKHSLVLREYLLRSGSRSEEQFAAFEHEILSKTWRPPFATARQMTCYGALQEATTRLLYLKQRAAATGAGDRVLERIYWLIARDEAAHAGFYETVLRVEIEDDRAGVLRDLDHVFTHFRMPADDLVPDYDRRVAGLRRAGVDRHVFLRDVWLRLLARLGVSRADVARTRRSAKAPDLDSDTPLTDAVLDARRPGTAAGC